ncbi:LacI family DNA-binding transcriptional regulator [Gryllotalpicola protaetiae]|uniref:LacI family DNA-binding transcriptional regulator n=1 Tax=Gryllotalpicola protaetiae TaxID=2419771 RepID=A0A387BST9_9MICO|nr:substrate-binding domain-containing protein [Gryllotalpicola protaetiae]AYG04096.1 LacI family DNA-binding transcriptional regulator [Gryllotalpicola protaetiae]
MTDGVVTGEAGGTRAQRATLSEVAALASVSVATVSKVLNGRSGVSDETRSRVESLLDERNYNRRTTAQSTAPLVDVLCFEIDSPFGSAAIAGVERITREQGIGMVVTGTQDSHQPTAAWVEGVLRRQPIGIILVAAALSEKVKARLRSRNIPVVMIDPYGAPGTDAPSIGSADWNGGYLATRHLVELGHTRIAIITGPDDMLASTARLSGYRAALDSAGLRPRRDWIKPGKFHHDDGLSQGLELLSAEGDDRPTAIFASSDIQALGVYDAARSLGLDVPGDVSVVGYDDVSIAKWAGPAMTTIHVPLAEMAEQAMHLVTRLRDEPELAFRRVDMATTLVARDSTAAPRA